MQVVLYLIDGKSSSVISSDIESDNSDEDEPSPWLPRLWAYPNYSWKAEYGNWFDYTSWLVYKSGSVSDTGKNGLSY